MKKKVLALLMSSLVILTLLTGSVMTVSAEEKDEKVTASSGESRETEEETGEAEVPEDGVYSALFETDGSMFHVNEACGGRGVLTVEDGKMIIHVSLTSKKIVNLFCGSSEEAKKDGAELLEPTLDTVTYDDGYTEEVYGFDIPVPALDEPFAVALIGTKGKWYDHEVIVSDPVAE